MFIHPIEERKKKKNSSPTFCKNMMKRRIALLSLNACKQASRGKKVFLREKSASSLFSTSYQALCFSVSFSFNSCNAQTRLTRTPRCYVAIKLHFIGQIHPSMIKSNIGSGRLLNTSHNIHVHMIMLPKNKKST